MKSALFLMLLCAMLFNSASHADTRLRAHNIAVIVNDADPDSVNAGRYYLKARQIPPRNLIKVRIEGSPGKLSAPRFATLKAQIDKALPAGIEVLALMWTAPYAVECNSITSALTLGFDATQCANTCLPGTPSPYFNSRAKRPRDAGLRLSMLVPVTTPKDTRSLIDRGVATRRAYGKADGYFLRTSDAARSSRIQFFPPSGELPRLQLSLHTIDADKLENARHIMFYQTGLAHVAALDTLRFLPGALADHLTSFGGDLLGKSQMSSLAWLQAGATASYGTVSEPCSYWQKFPNTQVLLAGYLSGDSAVEAYWKSVAWPAQGVFIGEPLAAPYCRSCKR
ncbi:TIGR03790 family protein [Craterilacuibacter sp.]|uniref:TIGR03790 family protein n=1 Tax=Craterilacuibacter sp. TaxID=2870909 RepID=UPI003F2AA245